MYNIVYAAYCDKRNVAARRRQGAARRRPAGLRRPRGCAGGAAAPATGRSAAPRGAGPWGLPAPWEPPAARSRIENLSGIEDQLRVDRTLYGAHDLEILR